MCGDHFHSAFCGGEVLGIIAVVRGGLGESKVSGAGGGREENQDRFYSLTY